jgi:hypothetical protein
MNIAAVCLVGVMSVLAADKPVSVEQGTAKAPPVATTDGPGALDDARKVAESYLKALEGKGNYALGLKEHIIFP